MFTLLGSLLGFFSSAFPDLLGIWRDRADRQHELSILDRQVKLQQQGHTQRLEAINLQADISESQALYRHDSTPSGVKWIDGLRASVRPILTYAFFTVFTTVKIAILVKLINSNVVLTDALILVWDAETQALFAAVMSFWFGQRALAKFRSQG